MARRTGIFTRDDGRYAACPVIEGKRRWFYGHTEHEVREKIDEARYLARRGLILIGTNQTVEQFLTEWLAGKAPPLVRESTHRMYGVHIRRALPAIGAFRLTKLKARHLQVCYADINQTHAPRTVHTMHRVLHQAFSQAVQWDLLAKNPAAGVKLPKIPRTERAILSREQVRILLDTTAGTRWHALAAVMCTTGLRISEATGLTWSDLHEEVFSLDVNRQTSRRAGAGMVFTPPKTESSVRSVLLTLGVVRALKRHRAIQAAERLHKGPDWQDHDLIFPNAVGGLSDPHSARRGLYRALTTAGLPLVTPHELRHTATTLLLEENRNQYAVQQMLGHASSTMTELYSHITPRVQQELADAMEALFFG